MRLSLVIPAHNEEDIIADTIKKIEQELSLDYEIVVVDDYSGDHTSIIIKELIKYYPNLRLIKNDGRRGFANALKKGFSSSESDLIIPVMADLCDDPGTIKEMYLKARDGFDVVCGSRYMKYGKKLGGPLLQSFFSRFVGCSLKYIIGLPTSDVSNSFKCYHKKVLDSIELKSEGFEISMEITLKAFFAGFRMTEVPTVWHGRTMGKSKFYLFKVAPSYIKLYLWAILQRKNIRNGRSSTSAA